MLINMETLLIASLIGNMVTEMAKIFVQKPTDDAKIDALHASLDEAISQLRKIVK